MKASVKNPEYTAFIISNGTKYDVTNALESIDLSNQDKQIAASATLTIANTKVNKQWFNQIPQVRDRVFIYANDGKTKDEVFRGFIWDKNYRSSLSERELELKCYDNLIYFQESEESEFFASGQSTESVLSTICNNWGITMEYSYESITHSKLVLRGTLSDIIMSDILDLVKDRTGNGYVILSSKDVIQIKGRGQNTTVYNIEYGKNAIGTLSRVTMDGMTTRVKILGKADKEDRAPVEATVDGNTSRYGTLQKIIDKDENTSLADAKKEAQNIIDKDGTPKKEYEVATVDIPWIKKGDKVNINAGDITTALIVKGISRDISISGCKMTLDLEEV